VQGWQSVSPEPEFLYKSVEPAQIEKILPRQSNFRCCTSGTPAPTFTYGTVTVTVALLRSYWLVA
jgi:hypothetical protein